ncbi:hypothetical protein O0L34_g1339 [Tuta absoluta]|nr:hypothetical protein O0L34_g1339 [Tuta absoluta]
MGKLTFPVVLLSCALQLSYSGSYKETPVRPLRTDDVLTPSDFLPVAKKLLEKVEYPGVGKGVVSSSKSYQQLADKLFQRFFFTNARFAALRAFDIPGLDTLQALALSGDDFNPSRQFEPLQRNHFYKGFPVRCRYKLMTKKIEKKKNAKHSPKKATEEKKPGKINRPKREVASQNSSTAVPTSQNGRRKISPHTVPEAKKLHKNRALVVKSKRKKRNTVIEEKHKVANKKRRDTKVHRINRASAPNLDTTVPPIENLDMPAETFREFVIFNKMNFLPPEKIDKENCYWQYKCPENKWAFFTCELFPECKGTKSDHFIRDDIPIAHKADEHEDMFLRFRKEIGVYLVDEEVEKIFEHRYIVLILPRQGKQAAAGGIQAPAKNIMEKKYGGANLQSYFQNLIQAERRTSTSTMAPEIKERKQRKSVHVYKYLKANNPYSDPKMQKRIQEAHMKRLRQAEEKEQEAIARSQQNKAVISWSLAVTTPLPDFMHRMKK